MPHQQLGFWKGTSAGTAVDFVFTKVLPLTSKKDMGEHTHTHTGAYTHTHTLYSRCRRREPFSNIPQCHPGVVGTMADRVDFINI